MSPAFGSTTMSPCFNQNEQLTMVLSDQYELMPLHFRGIVSKQHS